MTQNVFFNKRVIILFADYNIKELLLSNLKNHDECLLNVRICGERDKPRAERQL